jgi:hypothetical protein
MRNIELFYLLGKLTPGFRTISDLRKNNSKASSKPENIQKCLKRSVMSSGRKEHIMCFVGEKKKPQLIRGLVTLRII